MSNNCCLEKANNKRHHSEFYNISTNRKYMKLYDEMAKIIAQTVRTEWKQSDKTQSLKKE